MHTEPVLGAYCPATQLTHDVDPPLLDCPAGHAVQAVAPTSVLNCPTGHVTQGDPALAETCPAAHPVQVLLPPVLDWPEGHRLHDVAPATVANCPCNSAVQCAQTQERGGGGERQHSAAHAKLLHRRGQLSNVPLDKRSKCRRTQRFAPLHNCCMRWPGVHPSQQVTIFPLHTECTPRTLRWTMCPLRRSCTRGHRTLHRSPRHTGSRPTSQQWTCCPRDS